MLAHMLLPAKVQSNGNRPFAFAQSAYTGMSSPNNAIPNPSPTSDKTSWTFHFLAPHACPIPHHTNGTTRLTLFLVSFLAFLSFELRSNSMTRFS
jgi:hypothetical protein